LLGSFRVAVGLRTIEESEWRLRKAASLLKLLALAPEHRLHKEQVKELLWPDLAPKAASNNLHHALHHVRRTLEPTRKPSASRYLHLRGEQLALCPQEPLWVDVEAFEEAAIIAKRRREATVYRAALELYTGELLPEDRYEEWVQERREELKRTYINLLLELAALYEEREEFGAAIEALERTVAEEPTHEEAYARLMRLYTLSGRHQEALGQYERLRQVLMRELGREPAGASRLLYEKILAGRFPPVRWSQEAKKEEERLTERPPEEGRHNLPPAWISFVGRERELAEVKRMLAKSWLLTLTGAGGSGKTRLAIEVAKELVSAYRDGVWLVELAGLSEPELVAQEVAAALGVRERPDRPLVSTLIDALRYEEMLLVLDNCEHLLGAVARLAKALLKVCPSLRILATTREPLGVEGETEWRVPTLSKPDSQRPPAVAELSGYESVRLFLDRARQRNPAFALTQNNAWAVAQICERLEGIPLAIELAAARVGVLSVEQIARRLEGSVKLLAAGSRTMDPRHQTLRATLDWSYELLDEAERDLFERFSVFMGGWTLKAAEVIGAGDGIEEEDVLGLLSELIDKSLVVSEPGDNGAMRYRILEPIRQYAQDKLEESEEEVEAAKRRHASFFLALAEKAESELEGPQQQEWLERLDKEHDNLRAALSWALDQGEAELGLRLGGALGWFWWLRGHSSEGRRWLEAALMNLDAASEPTQAKGLTKAGRMVWEQGDSERAAALSEEGLALSRELGDTAGIVDALVNLGIIALFQTNFERVSALLEEAVALQRTVIALQTLGLVAVCQRDCERAMALHEETLALSRKIGDKSGTTLSLFLGALAALGLGNHRRVRELCAQGLEQCQHLGVKRGISNNLRILAALASSQGRPVRSARLWGAAEALYEAIGTTLSPAERLHFEPYIDADRAQLNQAMWEAAWAEGRAMTPEEAVEYALSEEEKPLPSVSPPPEESLDGRQPAKLTRRQQEVAALVGRGLTNRQIAEELSISERTVDAHLREILGKLGLDSRVQIAAWVAEQGPLPK